ncbi:lysophospholipase [Chitinimonas sp.]|uniref:alpha/beta hydrolase n=1 Tax=Chitinimonas sp. TaxID=1934313 RepID=UPI0035B331A2
MQIDTQIAGDGATLARYHWPAATPRRIVVIAHGMAEHAGRYDDFARFLVEHDCEVWALDHRGHGGSVQAGRKGHFADQGGFALVVGDLLALVEKARAALPGLPLVLFGHSMGSFISRAAVLQRPGLIDGLVLSATGFRQAPLARLMGWIAGRSGRKHGFDQPSVLMRKLVFGTFNLRFSPKRTGFEWLSRDDAQVDRYMADRDCGFDCSAKLWQDLFGAIVTMEQREAGGATLPGKLSVWLLAGSHDPVSMGGKGCKQLAERYLGLGLRDVVVTLYPKGRHEMLNETNRDEVYQAMLSWLERRFT